jgi:hypothetical protein
MENLRFLIRNAENSVLAMKSMEYAEAYVGTPHKQGRRLTPPGGKSTLSERKLINLYDSCL